MNGFESAQDEVDRAAGRRRRARGQRPQAHAHGDGPDAARDRRHHRHRHLRPHRNGSSESGRAGDRPRLRRGGAGLRLRGALLRRIRGDDSDFRQRLHLCLRNPRRDFRVDDRLGPDPRICGGIDDGGSRVERLLPADPRRVRHPPAGVDGGGARHRGRRAPQSPGDDHRRPHHRAARCRRARECALQRSDRRGEARCHPLLHRRWHHLREARELVAVHAIWRARYRRCGGGRVLRLHRLRCRVDDSGRGEESGARSTDWHHRFAGNLHGALSRCGWNSDRHHSSRAVQERPAVPQCPRRLRACGHQQGLGCRPRLRRRRRRHHQRAARHAHEPAAHLLFDEPRRSAATRRQQSSSDASGRPTSPPSSPA